MSVGGAFYKSYLKEELARRCEKNTRYSLRAFAKAIDIDVAALSKTFANKKPLSLKAAKRAVDTLPLAPNERRLFLDSVLEDHRAQDLKKVEPPEGESETKEATRELDIDLFNVIADWYHYAILELTFTDGFQSDAKWIASQLGISVTETTLAIDRLLRLGLLETNEDQLRKKDGYFTTKDKQLTTPALRKLQRQVLEKAIHSLENDPIEERSMTSVTMAIDPAKLGLAKKMVGEFMRSLCQVLESGKRKRVYHLGVSLYPVQKEEGIK